MNKSKENVILAFFSFEHCDGQMGGVGRTDDHASRYGRVVFGRYLLGWLIGMKVK